MAGLLVIINCISRSGTQSIGRLSTLERTAEGCLGNLRYAAHTKTDIASEKARSAVQLAFILFAIRNGDQPVKNSSLGSGQDLA